MTLKRVLVLGGYGNFGKHICENLSRLSGLVLIVGGRREKKVHAFVQQLQMRDPAANIESALIDLNTENFSTVIRSLNADVVIHTAGPFQGQGYAVPKACIEAGCHYIDLADDRRYVCDIAELDRRAKEKDVLVVSGASSVPGLSSSVVQHFIDGFHQLHSIDIAIAPGNRAERGLATLRAILSYTGHEFLVFSGGKWVVRYGWMSARRWGFGPLLGRRWLANVDVPDLELLPALFKVRDRVSFQAGLELAVLHFAMVAMAQLGKWRLVKNWSVYSDWIFKLSRLFDRLGSDNGGMRIELKGVDTDGTAKTVNWVLSANNGVGPYIPTLAAIVIAKKLLNGKLTLTGAMPCIGLFDLQEFDEQALPLGILHGEESNCG